MRLFKELYAYREMIFNLVKRDLKGRYKGSVLGFLWTFLNPLLQLVVYTIVFSMVMIAPIEEYYLFLFVALVPWIMFATSVSGGCSCIRAQQDMVKKIYFPREVLPISYVTSQLVNMVLSFLVVFLVLLLAGKGLDPYALLFLPIIVLVEYLLAMGFCMIFSALTVYLRDLEYLLGIFILAWQFLSPIMYDISMVPEEIMPIFEINPMTPVIIAYRDILFYQKAPELSTLTSASVFGIVIVVLGFLVFGKLQKHFAEEM